jgi:hypothetical protein
VHYGFIRIDRLIIYLSQALGLNMIIKFRSAYLAIGFLILLNGCKPADGLVVDAESRNAVANLTSEMMALKGNLTTSLDEIANLKNKINNDSSIQKDLEERLNQLIRRVYTLELEKTANSSVTIDPGLPKAYQRLDSTTGSFFVLLESVTPYLDGQKVTLTIGNPSSATYSGFTLKVKWGPRYPTYDPKDSVEYFKQLELVSKSTQQRDIKLTDSLIGGRWNRVSFNLTPAAAKDFGRLELEIVTDTMQLIK